MITVDMIHECRRKMQGIIAADIEGDPIVRSEIHFDGPDPLYDGSGDQIVVLTADDLIPPSDEFTDEDVAEDLTYRWADLAEEARHRWESMQ